MVVDANKALNTIKHVVTLFLAVTRTDESLKKKVELHAATVCIDVCKGRMRVLRLLLIREVMMVLESIPGYKLPGCDGYRVTV